MARQRQVEMAAIGEAGSRLARKAYRDAYVSVKLSQVCAGHRRCEHHRACFVPNPRQERVAFPNKRRTVHTEAQQFLEICCCQIVLSLAN